MKSTEEKINAFFTQRGKFTDCSRLMAMETKAFAFSGASVVILIESNNEKKIRENLQFPVLTATLLFDGETLTGHHQGMRTMRKERTFKSRGLKVHD